MTKIPNRESLLVRARGHYDRIKLYADLHIAEANSGAATLRNIRKGREATPMEKTIGEVIGWVDLTDLEKTQDSLNTATRHIQALENLTETICALVEDDPVRYQECIAQHLY